jgi:hypothetical protein
MPCAATVILMRTVADADVDQLAGRATGIEQELIELVARRSALAAAGLRESQLENEIAELQDELGAVGDLVASR